MSRSWRNRAMTLRGWWPLLVYGAVLAITLCIVAAVRAHPDPAEGTSDFRDFWLTARHFRTTGEISSQLGVHNYLPFFTIFMVPWSLLPLRLAAALFVLLSVVLLGLTVVMVELLLEGALGPRPRKAMWVSVLLISPYAVSALVLGQVDVLILFLIVATWFLVERGWERVAGAPLGLAVAIKLMPAILVLFFLLKLRWRVFGTSAGVALVLALGLPMLSLGFSRTLHLHADFYERAVRGHSARETILTEKPHKAKYSNNALPMVLRRLLTPVDGNPQEGRPGLFVNFADLPRQAVWWLYLFIGAGLLVASMAAALRGPPAWPPEALDDVRLVRVQFAVWCSLMLLATPLMWTHYLVLAYWPLALVSDRSERSARARKRPDPWMAAALLGWLLGAVLLAWPAARAAGAQLWSVTLLWLILVWTAIRTPTAQPLR